MRQRGEQGLVLEHRAQESLQHRVDLHSYQPPQRDERPAGKMTIITTPRQALRIWTLPQNSQARTLNLFDVAYTDLARLPADTGTNTPTHRRRHRHSDTHAHRQTHRHIQTYRHTHTQLTVRDCPQPTQETNVFTNLGKNKESQESPTCLYDPVSFFNALEVCPNYTHARALTHVRTHARTHARTLTHIHAFSKGSWCPNPHPKLSLLNLNPIYFSGPVAR